jgi:hypothetical protein
MHARRDWAFETFGSASTGDARRLRRVVDIAAKVAAVPAGTVTRVFDDSAEREAAYRLLSNDGVTSTALAEAMFRSTARQCAVRKTIYVVSDGSSLSVTDRRCARDVGWVGAWEYEGRGLHVISALALDTEGTPIGICAQTWWARTAPSPDVRNDFRPLDKKETRFLAATIRSSQEVVKGSAPDTHVVHVADRGFDAASVLALAKDENAPCSFIIRAAQDRRLDAQEEQERRYLKESLKATPIRGRYSVHVPERPNRRARIARVQVQAAAVEVSIPVTRKRRDVVRLNAVLVRELDGPKGQCLSWLLLTTEPIDSYEQIAAIIRAYSYRWRIEEFHRTWKRGGCNVEDMQLRSREGILKWATIHAAVAARAIHLTKRARTEPNIPASEEFTQLEIDAVIALRRKRTRLKFGDVPNLETMVRLVAEAGGYTGKSSGGPPGPTVIARGLERLAIAAEVLSSTRSDE